MSSQSEVDTVNYINPDQTRVVKSNKVWTVLLTNSSYLEGVLTLDYSLKRANSKYPLVVLYTDGLEARYRHVLEARKIPMKLVRHLMPKTGKEYIDDPRFNDCWTKLTPFSLVEYDRVVQLDADMLVRKNMDELMDLELDAPGLRGDGKRVFAASHACVCNPLKKTHYPADWIPDNCAYTTQHSNVNAAQENGAPPDTGLGMLNGGLQVVIPSAAICQTIRTALESPDTAKYEFADQSLLSAVFSERWVPLPYTYNALKTMRWKDVHSDIWRDDNVKNVHFILSPKPWLETKDMRIKRTFQTEVNDWWWTMNDERQREEKENGLEDRW